MSKLSYYYKVAFSVLLGLARSIFSDAKYHIKRGYKHRKDYQYFDDRGWEDKYQKEIYEMVARELDHYQFKTVIDLGCGSAYKLINYLGKYNTIGIDVDPTYEFLLKEYPERTWLKAEETNFESLKADVVICADVIEHVLYPNQLIDNILKIDFKFLFISTPERNIMNGYLHYGPPSNPCHVREWNGTEFKNYVSQHFEIISHQITNFEQATQLIICKKK